MNEFVTIRVWSDDYLELVTDEALEFDGRDGRLSSKNVKFYHPDTVKEFKENPSSKFLLEQNLELKDQRRLLNEKIGNLTEELELVSKQRDEIADEALALEKELTKLKEGELKEFKEGYIGLYEDYKKLKEDAREAVNTSWRVLNNLPRIKEFLEYPLAGFVKSAKFHLEQIDYIFPKEDREHEL